MESGTMLVLSRRLNETIVIGDNIRVTLVGIGGHQVRLGIEAPGDIKVVREELLLRGGRAAEGQSPSPVGDRAATTGR
jgi:carbon storage regulator